MEKSDFKDAMVEDIDFSGNCKQEYDRVFSELSEEEKRENLDKPLHWVEDIWIYPDGTTKGEEQAIAF